MSNTTDHEQKLSTIIQSNTSICDTIRHNVDRFLSLREDLLNNSNIKDLSAYNEILSPLIEGLRVEQLKTRIASTKVQLAFCGENSSGKSAFIQTFLGIGKILPSGDGPVTARITKLTYASASEASIYIWKTLRDQTSSPESIVSLSSYFDGDKPNWAGIASVVSTHLRRPVDIDETEDTFAEWARTFVEIRIPSSVLALGIDVYDTPGFLMDDAKVLKDILHDLVELIHPTIVFMYANPSTDDAANSCFVAMTTALQDLDSSSIFFLNSKADIAQMKQFKRTMTMPDFLSMLEDERARRYQLLLASPFIRNNHFGEQCSYFDLCSVNSQIIKPFGPKMNETTIQHIIEFVTNNDLTIATRVCKLVLPIIDGFFNLIHLTSTRTTDQLLQIRYDALNWEKNLFEMYKIYTKTYIDDLFTNIFKEFDKEDESIIKLFANNRRLSETFERDIQSAVRLKILIPVVKNSLSTLMKNVLDQFKSNIDLTQGIAFNEILVNALNREEISDFTALLLDERILTNQSSIGIIYAVNTISVPIVQCSKSLREKHFPVEFMGDHKEKQKRNETIRRYLVDMRTIIEDQRDVMNQAIELWGDKQQAMLRSLIERHYLTISPTLASHQQTLKDLERYSWHLISIECELRAAEDFARFNGSAPEIENDNSQSTIFSICPAKWGNETNLMVKKLSQTIPNQPHASWYEAHYHMKISNLFHPNILNLRYLYKNDTELWMIFPLISLKLEQLLQQPSTVLPFETVLSWMCGLADVLAMFSRNEIVHRNINLSNLAITEDQRLLLIDLGNWTDDCEISQRHNSSNDLNDVNAFGEIGVILSTSIIRDEKTLLGIDIFYELMAQCTQANQEKPITPDTILQKLRFIQDMF